MDVTFYHPKTWMNMETEVRTLDRERPNLQCVSSLGQVLNESLLLYKPQCLFKTVFDWQCSLADR